MKKINFWLIMSVSTAILGFAVVCYRDRTFHSPINILYLLPSTLLIIGVIMLIEIIIQKIQESKAKVKE